MPMLISLVWVWAWAWAWMPAWAFSLSRWFASGRGRRTGEALVWVLAVVDLSGFGLRVRWWLGVLKQWSWMVGIWLDAWLWDK
jgi:hypothetical protein